VVPGGTFTGDRLSGIVLDGGSDWQTVRGDGATTLDVRVVHKTDDDALIAMTYQGLRHGPADVNARVERAKTSIRRAIISARLRASRPLRPDTTGSIALSRSALGIVALTGPSTASSKSCERRRRGASAGPCTA
jgi:hypothetical protein